MNKDSRLTELKNKYGRVARITLSGIDIYLRGLYFGEWLSINKEIRIIIFGNQRQYDVTERGIEQYILPCILYPSLEELKDTIINKPVHLNFIVSTVLEITEFNDENKLIQKYKRELAFQTRVAEEIKRVLISTFGISVLDYIEKANADKIMELIAMSEWMTGNLGQFFGTLNMKNEIPITRTGKINTKKLDELLETWLNESIMKSNNNNTKESTNEVTISKIINNDVHINNVQQMDSIYQSENNNANEDNIINNKKQTDNIKTNSDNYTYKQDKENIPLENKKIKTISDVYKEKGYMEEDIVEVEHSNDGKHPPIVKVNMSDDEITNMLSKIKEPKIYVKDPHSIDKAILKIEEKEFNGQLIDMWNETSIALYEKIQEDYKRGKRIKFKNADDLFMSELRDLKIDDLLDKNKGE